MKKLCWMAACVLAASVGFASSVVEIPTKAQQRYPWNGLVDIVCNAGNIGTDELPLLISVTNAVTGEALRVKTLTLNGKVFTNGFSKVAMGTHHFIWNAAEDVPNGYVGERCGIKVTVPREFRYMIVDLSRGSGAASYPVTYFGEVPPGGWTDEYKLSKLVLRRIPAGSFMMGSPSNETGRDSSDESQHKVTLTKDFYMGVYEVTQKQWELVMGSNPSSYTDGARPVESVSYNNIRGSLSGAKWPSSSDVDATSFMGKLRAKTGLATFDLPTEAQWEYACRAGTTTALNSGKNLTSTSSCANMAEVGRYSSNQNDGKGGYSSNHTTVGSYLPNAWGLYDMHGNVYEWCLDWYAASLGVSDAADPVGATSGSARLLRGGYWYYNARRCRSAHRNGGNPSGCGDYYGFRLCCSAGL